MNKKNKIKGLLLIFFITYFVSYSSGQQIRVNDSTYLIVNQDTFLKEKTLNPNNSYKVGVYFVGFLYREIIKVKRNSKLIYQDTVSTWDSEDINSYKPNRKFFLTIKKGRKNNNLQLLFNGDNLIIPFRYGYQILNIRLNDKYDKKIKRKIKIYSFQYTNKLPAEI